ncbi:MAG: aminopeptidase P family protein, partial [Clostridiales bacterium]|nr:aminopeptidase P family protein [Clostridiales bacterium]
MTVNERVDLLRGLMGEKGIDAYIVTKFDPHMTEDSPEHYNYVKFISGFTGSNATVLITKDEALLWTDGRYFVQAHRQLKGTYFKMQKENSPKSVDYKTYARDITPQNGVMALNGATISVFEAMGLIDKLSQKDISLQIDIDLIGGIWEDRPELSNNKVFIHDIKYAGECRQEKISRVRGVLKEESIDAYVISSLDDIAWLFNLRGNDVPNNTTFASYVVITQEDAALFVHSDKISDCVEELAGSHVTLKPYDGVPDYLNSLGKDKIIAFDNRRSNYLIYSKISSGHKVRDIKEITSEMKACKNKVEIENIKNVNIRDSAYMVRFIKWLKENVGKQEITELDISEKLIEIRGKDKNYLSPSFKTIAAYMGNAAMMHYSATEESYSTIKPEGFLLVDSGGQYLDGTTDVTRTIVLGSVSSEMKRDYTLTLKSNISLARAVFLKGVSGVMLDMLARQPMWNNLMDYKCGTGHGIGFCLNVHEGPQNISTRVIAAPFKEGMILSNEPGVYR